jgi:serine/threonine protein kinase
VPEHSINDVPFARALEILEVSAEGLEQLLDEGALRGYRRGSEVVFKRDDLAAYITRRSEPISAPSPFAPAAPASQAPPPPPVPAPPPPQRSRRQIGKDSKRDTLKRAAMGGTGPSSEMFSMKQKAVEHGLVPEEQAPPRMLPPQVDAEAEILRSENESLRARLKAAEEVLNDLQRRCENAAQHQSQNQMLVDEVQQLRVLQTELEARIAAYEDMDTGGAEGPRWGQPDPEQQLMELKHQTATMRGELAAAKRRLDDRERDFDRLRMERDELSSKLKVAATPGVDIAHVRELETEIVVLKQERDTLAVEAQIAKELKGEIERASELEEKLQTQREVIEAAQKGLAELEDERNEMAMKVKILEEQLAGSESSGAQVEELLDRVSELETIAAETSLKSAQIEARATSLREERDKLQNDLEKRSNENAELRVQVDRAKAGAEGLDDLKKELEATKAKAAAFEQEASDIKVQISLKDQLMEQLKVEGESQTELAKSNSALKQRQLELETKARQNEARLTAMRAERDNLNAELAKRDGAMDELRTQAERATLLTGDNKSLLRELDTDRERIAQLQTELEASRIEREKLLHEHEESQVKAKVLEERVREQERNLGSIRAKVADGPGPGGEADKLRGELEALRGEISRQMQELGQMRVQGEQATTHRKSALDIAARRRMPTVRKQQGTDAAKKPAKLGRFEIGEETRRTRTGVFYGASMGSGGKRAEVLVLPVDLTRDRYFLDRFWREMRIVVELEEKGLLGVLDVGETSGIHYVAYEHIEGETLEAILRKEEPIPVARSVEIAVALLDALVVAAKNKLVHGDIKPENIIIAEAGKVRLSGLGLARGTDEDASSLNERGRLIHYGAPEQILGEDRDTRSDIWSIGAVLLRMVSGKMPLEAGSLAEIRGLIQAGELPRAKDLIEIPDDLRECLAKMLAEEPENRYQEAADASKALAKLKG